MLMEFDHSKRDNIPGNLEKSSERNKTTIEPNYKLSPLHLKRINEIAEILKIEKQITYDLKILAKRKLIRKEIKSKIMNKIEEFEQKKLKYLEDKKNITAKNNEEKAKIIEELFQINQKKNRHSNAGINPDSYLLNKGSQSINFNELMKAKKYILEMKRKIDYVKISPQSCINAEPILRSKKNFSNVLVIQNGNISRKNQSPTNFNIKSEDYHILLRKAQNLSQFENNIIKTGKMKYNYLKHLPNKNKSICNIAKEANLNVEEERSNNNFETNVRKQKNNIPSFENLQVEKLNIIDASNFNELKENKKSIDFSKKINNDTEKIKQNNKNKTKDHEFLLNNEEISNFDWVQRQYSTKFVELINRKKKKNQLLCDASNYKTAEIANNDANHN